MNITATRIIGKDHAKRALSYSGYRQLVDDLFAAGRVTGPVQSQALSAYTKLNLQRMRRIEKTIVVLPEVKKATAAIVRPQTWLVLAEGWCGDAAQVLPVINAVAQTSPLITLKILLRDENLELMDQYLTNGSRSIPKLVAIDTASGEELFTWGPRPSALQQLFTEWKNSGLPAEEVKERIHSWYAVDKTVSTQLGLIALL